MKISFACLLLWSASANVALAAVPTLGGEEATTEEESKRELAGTEYSCLAEEGHQVIDATEASPIVSLGNAPELCTLTVINPNGELIPIGRSYDGRNWERSAGPFVDKVAFTCASNKCTVDLSEVINDPVSYQDIRITTFKSYLDPSDVNYDKSVRARFLEQATFGTTHKDLNEWNFGSFEEWIQNQMAIPLTSHREFFREHTNPRLDRVFDMGKTYDPCEKGGRWRTTALTSKDKTDGKVVSFHPVDGGTGEYVLKVDGDIRTIVESKDLEDGVIVLEDGREYEVCRNRWHQFWKESFGDEFRIKASNGQCYGLKDGIPIVDLSLVEASLPNMIDLTGAALKDIDDVQYNSEYWESIGNNMEYILEEDFLDSACEALPTPYFDDGTPNPTIYGKVTLGNYTQYLLYDARLDLVENTIENPAHDGGGATSVATDGIAKCMNAPRNFLNEDHCFLSYDENACSPDVPAENTITLDGDFLKQIDDITGRHLVAFIDIPLDEDMISHQWYDARRKRTRYTYYHRRLVCDWWAWKRVTFRKAAETDCQGEYMKVHNDTHNIFAHLLRAEFNDAQNPDPTYKEVVRRNNMRCHRDDRSVMDVGFIMTEEGTCWKHVHPLEGNIYDMSVWVQAGELDSNPIPDWVDIKTWATEPGGAILSVPREFGNKFMYESVDRYYRSKYPRINGHLYDTIRFNSLPRHMRTVEVEEAFGEVVANEAGQGVVICGSLGEVANKPELGNAFEVVKTHRFDWKTDTDTLQNHQKSTVWSTTALQAEDQLRQRTAWSLSQILVIAPSTLGDHWNTEASLQYYDIFVRNAFGCYRDILKQVAFSEKMGRMLSSINNRAYQWNRDRGREALPDENFAREIMQLFSIGINHLNMDGTEVKGDDGDAVSTYDSEILMSYARVWTGLYRQPWRGNNDARASRVDPMPMRVDWHDVFPKSDLSGGYLGEKNYPLCIDLPDKHFLRQGATFRLLGSKNRPEWVQDPWWWEKEPSILRLELASDSPLFSKLCKADADGTCTFPGKVVLNTDLIQEYSSGDFDELKADTLRTVKVQSGVNAIYYEYIREACVEQSFYPNPTKVEDSVRGRNRYAFSSMCADPRRDVAAESCCKPGWQDTRDTRYHGFKNCVYSAERMTKSTAESRCSELGDGWEQCTSIWYRSDQVGLCGIDIWRNIYYSWTNRDCQLKVKVNEQNHIAIVHDVEMDYAAEKRVWDGVSEETGNYFIPAWIDEMPANCTTVESCYESDEGCVCSTTLSESSAFPSATFTKEDVMNECFIGAPDPSKFDAGVYTELSCGVTGVTVFAKEGDCENLGTDAIFRIEDNFGVTRHLKNLVSIVSIDSHSFRNPVQFHNFADPELRDAYHEVEAALDSYFYHPSHPPFLAHLMLQRFGHSNPSPNLIKGVAEAYKEGTYNGIGSGEYGCMGAMIAAILLHPESTSVSLTADPVFGQLKEPLIKVVELMRNMGYHYDSPLTMPFLSSLRNDIGQGPHEQPGVFNFFLPEFTPNGATGSAGLTSPEMQVLNGRRLTEMLDGMLRLTRNGLDQCEGGFATYRPLWCRWGNGDTSRSYGSLTYADEYVALGEGSIDEMLDELSLLLTSSRLSPEKQELIKIATHDEFAYSDRHKAIRTAIELMVTTPEFHTTALARQTDQVRQPVIDTVKSEKGYKAIVFLMLNGGMDSWNMLVPKCDELWTQYYDVRTKELALPKDQLDDIDASGTGQVCNEFGINKALKIGKELYDNKEAVFFASVGVLEHPVDRYNYRTTDTKLFAHNWQQREVMKMDMHREHGETGVGGRILDALKKKGYKTSSNTVDNQAVLATGSPVENNPVRQVSSGYSRQFNRRPTFDHSTERITQLNGVAPLDKNSVMAEDYSTRLMQTLHENDEAAKLSRMTEFHLPKFRNRETHLDRRFRRVAEFIKSHEYRNVDRELYVIQDGGYDMHSGDFLNNKLTMISDAIKSFKNAMVEQDKWEDVVIVSGSDFGRTLVPNGGGGTDHAWSGHGFILGGGLAGGKVHGHYPEDITETGQYVIGRRGRVVPTTSLNTQWNALANFMGITDEAELDAILPNRKNFDKCDLFTDQDLFKDWTVPSYCSAGDESNVV